MNINFGQILLQAINFGLLVFILTKLLYRPIVKHLEARTKKIDDSLKAAEANLAEKQTIAAEKAKTLIAAEKEAAAILDQARHKAETVGKDLVEAAKVNAQAEVQKEYHLLQEKIKAERHSLKAEVANLVIDTTKTVLESSLHPQHQQEIINSQIQSLKKLKVVKS